MKLVHIVPHIDQEAAGPSYSVPRLCQSLAAHGNQVELSCLAARGDISGVRLDLHPQWPWFNRFAISTSFVRALSRKAAVADVVHNHSLWSMVNVAAGWVVPGRHAKLVTSPRGTLSTWALSHSSTAKQILWPLQRRVLERADMLHATSEEEYHEIRALGLTAPVLIVPNGIDVPNPSLHRSLKDRSHASLRTLLFLSRIHPKKGIDRLLHAWVRLQDVHPSWRLVIAGTGEYAHVEEARMLAAKLDVKRVEFTGPVYGDDKTAAYKKAELFVLPTHSENFGMVVAEALAHGCAAIVGLGAPWSGLHSEACGWWVGNDVETLIVTLDAALRTPSTELSAMGERGRQWMERDYGWASVAQKMDIAYRWLVAGGDRPDGVRVN